jgi:membrane fusion protein (multidrug efflux system)
VAQTNPRRFPLLVLGVAGAVLALSFVGFYTSDAATKGREREARIAQAREGGVGPAGSGAIPNVEVYLARRTAATEWIEISGLLEPVRATWVAAEIAGRVVQVAAEEHSSVPADALLVQLDPALPRADVIRAEANHRLAQLDLERQQNLGRRSVASEAERDRAQAEERGSYAALLEARKRLDQTRIRSPFAGVVNTLSLDPGAYVAPGTQIAEVLDVATVEIEVEVSDRQVGSIANGDPVRVRIDPLGNARMAGKVARVARAPNSETQRFPIVVALDNAEGKMLPGMLATVELEIGRRETIRVPRRAVVREFEIDYVFAVARDGEERGTLKRQRVRTRPVPFRPDWVELESGLEAGSWVVTSDVGRLTDGATVRITGERS